MRIADFLARLEGVRLTGKNQWTALCPGHNDQHPSLSITEADGKILIKCFAGCDLMDILKPLRLEQKDLFFDGRETNSPINRQREIETVYPYTDANGKPFEVVRFRPKDFAQRRPDGKGGYIWNLKGIIPTLYHQAELPTGDGMPIYLAEGEKDVDRLRGLGLVATCNSGGAGKWRDAYSEALRGADVIIIPDKDEPGRRHAQQVAKSLQGNVASVKVLELPGESKDISDWLDNGGTQEELHNLTVDAPEWTPQRDAETKASEVCVPGFILSDGTIGEMVINEGRRCFILRMPGGTTSKAGEYATGSIVYKPMADNLAGDTVSFASGAAEYGSLGDLLNEVRGFIGRYVELPSNFEAISALYVLLSWVHDSLPAVPYLRALGDYGTGKTRFLEVIGSIVFRGINASGATTPSPIFRILDMYGGSLILDEADFSQSDSMAEIIKILNSGYKPGSPVLRAEPTGGKKWIPCSYKVFGPKILATRKRWSDKALESRCLTWESEGLTRADVPLVLGSRFHGEVAALRCKLLRFRLTYLPKVLAFNLEDALPVGILEPRLQEILLPLKALVEDDTSLEATLNEFVGNMQAELEEDRRSSLPALVLEAVLDIREEDGELSVKNITNRLNETDRVKEHLDRPEKGITPRRVGATVKNLGLKTKQDPTSRRAIIQWDSKRLARLCRRYGFPIPLNNASKASIEAEMLRPNASKTDTMLREASISFDLANASKPGHMLREASTLPDTKSSKTEAFEGFEASFGGMKEQDDDTPPSIPCYRDDQGICILRTDDSKLFQCAENPGRCQFKKVDGLGGVALLAVPPEVRRCLK